MDQVHFHEVGATDAIVDIVGTCLGLNYLKVDTVLCSPLPTGRGRVFTAHGWLPVPAPAVLKLMEMTQVPLYSNGLHGGTGNAYRGGHCDNPGPAVWGTAANDVTPGGLGGRA